MKVAPPSTLFGLSRALTSQEAQSLSTFLSKAWSAQRGRPPAALQTDLGYLRVFFAPTVTGRKLRETITQLPKVSVARPAAVTDEIFLSSPSGRGLVTPEGRIALHLLRQSPDRDGITFSTESLAWAYSTVAEIYRQWGRDRILEALGIKAGALRLPVIAFNLTLLINGSVGEVNALPIPTTEKEEQELSRIIAPILDSFVNSLKEKRRRAESFRLRGGWILSETSRHLFEHVSFAPNAIWIHHNSVEPLIQRLGRELAERDRNRSRADVEHAFDALVHAYSRARPALASRAVVHERSSETRAVRELLLAQYDRAVEGRRLT